MSDRLDQEIRSTVVELIESSPAPHPAHVALRSRPPRRPLTMRSGLVRMLAVAVVVLVIGLAGAWIGRILVPAEVGGQVPVVGGTPAPEPGFDPSVYGDEVRLLPSTGDVQPDIVSGTVDGDVVAVGRIEGTDLEVFTWKTTDPTNGTCLQIARSIGGDTTCGGALGDEPEPARQLVLPRFDEASRDPIDVVGVWQVPDRTAIVAADAGESSFWQSPNGGVVAFTFDPDTPSVILKALDTDQQTIKSWGISPKQNIDQAKTGETGIEAATEDLTELVETHPAMRLLAQGATDHESFAEAASAQELQFTCAAGGGFPPWELCLVAADGVLAVVPFEGIEGLVARVQDSHLTTDVVVPLDTSQPVGILNTGPQASVDIEYLSQGVVGEMSTTWSPSRERD